MPPEEKAKFQAPRVGRSHANGDDPHRSNGKGAVRVWSVEFIAHRMSNSKNSRFRLTACLMRARPKPNRDRAGKMQLWGIVESPLCSCDREQTIKHIVEVWPLTKFSGGIEKIHGASPGAINWMENLNVPSVIKLASNKTKIEIISYQTYLFIIIIISLLL